MMDPYPTEYTHRIFGFESFTLILQLFKFVVQSLNSNKIFQVLINYNHHDIKWLITPIKKFVINLAKTDITECQFDYSEKCMIMRLMTSEVAY